MAVALWCSNSLNIYIKKTAMSLFRNHNLVTKKNQKNNKKNQQTFVRWVVSFWDYFLCTKLSPPIVTLITGSCLWQEVQHVLLPGCNIMHFCHMSPWVLLLKTRCPGQYWQQGHTKSAIGGWEQSHKSLGDWASCPIGSFLFCTFSFFHLVIVVLFFTALNFHFDSQVMFRDWKLLGYVV